MAQINNLSNNIDPNERICRTCLSSVPNMKRISDEDLYESFNKLVDKEVAEADYLPQWICLYCFVLVKKFNLFRRISIRSANILKNYLTQKMHLGVEERKAILKRERETLPWIKLSQCKVNIIECGSGNNNQSEDNVDLPTIDPFNNISSKQLINGEIKLESKYDPSSYYCLSADSTLDPTKIDIKLEYDDGQFGASDDEPIVKKLKSKKSKIKNYESRRKRLNNIVNTKHENKPDNCNSPSKNFDMSLVNVTILTRDEQMKELEKVRNSEEYLQAPHKCETCARGFAHEIVYKEHKLKHEAESGQFVCDLCSQRFSSRRNLNNHQETHSSRYGCRLCGKVVISRQNIMLHMHTEHDRTNTPVRCELCHKLYKNRYTYTKHMRIHNNSKEYKCHLCPKVFLWKDNLNRHLTRHKNDRPFSCDQCTKSFYLKENLKDHMLVHSASKRFYCVECDLSYASQAKLNQHLNRGTKHLRPEQLTFACSMCSSRYTNNLQLSLHVDRVHLHKRPNPCPTCEAAFVSKKSLQAHVRAVHEGFRKPKDQICETCGKGFSSKQVLRAHIRTHTGEKPYCCPHCGTKFAHSGALHTHIKLIHLKLKRRSPTATRTAASSSLIPGPCTPTSS